MSHHQSDHRLLNYNADKRTHPLKILQLLISLFIIVKNITMSDELPEKSTKWLCCIAINILKIHVHIIYKDILRSNYDIFLV